MTCPSTAAIRSAVDGLAAMKWNNVVHYSFVPVNIHFLSRESASTIRWVAGNIAEIRPRMLRYFGDFRRLMLGQLAALTRTQLVGK